MAETRSSEPLETRASPRSDATQPRERAWRRRARSHAPAGRRASRAGTLSAELEELRLSHRHARIEHVLEAMHELARGHGGSVPAPLAAGIDDFRGELTRVAARLRELRADAAGFGGRRNGKAHDDGDPARQ